MEGVVMERSWWTLALAGGALGGYLAGRLLDGGPAVLTGLVLLGIVLAGVVAAVVDAMRNDLPMW
jgi:hypothetical protein